LLRSSKQKKGAKKMCGEATEKKKFSLFHIRQPEKMLWFSLFFPFLPLQYKKVFHNAVFALNSLSFFAFCPLFLLFFPQPATPAFQGF